jgi:septal ring factor EnvC (AmiA/AmiB activator)
MAEFEFGGMTFKGGKMMIMLTALSSLGGAAWAGFEFYNDYRNMKEVVQNIDIEAIQAENVLVVQKMDDNMARIEEAIEYTRDIKSGLRDDILSIEKQADRVEDQVRASEEKVRDMIEKANERFETKRDSLRADNDRELKDLETRLTTKLQKALDNPLAD